MVKKVGVEDQEEMVGADLVVTEILAMVVAEVATVIQGRTGIMVSMENLEAMDIAHLNQEEKEVLSLIVDQEE